MQVLFPAAFIVHCKQQVVLILFTDSWHANHVYGRTSRKRPPKMQRLNGRLRKVVVYKNRTTEGLFGEEIWAHLLYGR